MLVMVANAEISYFQNTTDRPLFHSAHHNSLFVELKLPLLSPYTYIIIYTVWAYTISVG